MSKNVKNPKEIAHISDDLVSKKHSPISEVIECMYCMWDCVYFFMVMEVIML